MIMMFCEWDLQVERGAGCLFVKVGQPLVDEWELPSLAETVQSVLERHFECRLVLELDAIGPLSAELVDQFLAIEQWTRSRNGFLRLCGLSRRNAMRLKRLGLGRLLPLYPDRREAVFGSYCPTRPR